MAVISRRKLLANRRNAKKSTGPKNTELSKYNNTTYGLQAKTAILPEEEGDAWMLDELRMKAREKFEPDGEVEKQLVEQVVMALWKLRRAERAEAAIMGKYNSLSDKTRWSDLFDDGYLDRIAEYRSRSMHHINRASETLLTLKAMNNIKSVKAREVKNDAK